jgi:hypothetical protein
MGKSPYTIRNQWGAIKKKFGWDKNFAGGAGLATPVKTPITPNKRKAQTVPGTPVRKAKQAKTMQHDDDEDVKAVWKEEMDPELKLEDDFGEAI